MALNSDIGLTNEDIQKLADKSIPETTTYAIDWENGRLSGQITEKEALRQYIYKTLKTEANKYLIYDMSVGTSINALVGQGTVSRAFLEADIPRMVRKALSDARILEITDFAFSYSDDERDAITISFRCRTIYGELKEEVTV